MRKRPRFVNRNTVAAVLSDFSGTYSMTDDVDDFEWHFAWSCTTLLPLTDSWADTLSVWNLTAF